ncbi:hypothetical protein M0805_001422 [Coniferiporia weirii]|nr:hypothetical protein M0805_001422 [Coniferiporia weirii]
MSSSSLSTVVSTLVRASMGSPVPETITDAELDRHVAELILKEAKQKAERYLQDGVRAYLPDTESDSNLPKANKRFLSAIIRSTDDHNKAILRAQAEAAQEVRAEREEQERRERRARAIEATEAGRLQRLMGGSSRRREDTWDRSRDNEHRRRSRDATDRRGDRREDESSYHKKRRRHSRSPSRERRHSDSERHRRRMQRDDEDTKGSSSRKDRKRPRSRSPDDRDRSSSKHEHSRRSDRHREDREATGSSSSKGKEVERLPPQPPSWEGSALPTSKSENSSKTADEEVPEVSKSSAKHHRRSRSPSRKTSPADLSSQFRSRKAAYASPPPPASPTLSEEEDIERLRPRRHRRRASPKPSSSKASRKDKDAHSSSPKPTTSKMDKYFDASYDPRFDIGPLSVPTVPSAGLIDNAEFESWEAMLDIIRQRREDKAEQKRLERLGQLPDKDKGGKDRKPSEAWTMESGAGIMDIKYNKRGAVREWDMGKEGF